MLIISPDRKIATFGCWPAGQGAEQHSGWPVVPKKDPVSQKWIR